MVPSATRLRIALALSALLLVLPGSALAATPTAFTSAPSVTGPTTAILIGTAFAGDEAGATAHFEYALGGSSFCLTGSGTHSQTAPQNVAIEDTPLPFSSSVAGLTSGQTYCEEIVVVNTTSGPSGVHGGLVSFVAGSQAITVALTTPDGTGPDTERVSGSVSNFGSAAAAHFAYGPAVNPGSPTCSGAATAQATADQPVTGSGAAAVSATISGLTSGSSYCARLVAQDSAGSATSPAVLFVAGAPDVVTLAATAISGASAAFNAGVSPEGVATTARFEWGTASGAWCSTGGASGTPARSVSQTIGSDATTHTVTDTASGLSAEVTYCFRATAQNARGTTRGGFQQFKATAPAPIPAPAPGSGTAGVAAAGGATGATGATGPQARGPFDYLTVDAVLYDPKFKTVRFSVTVGGASKIEVRLRAKKGRKIVTVGKFNDTLGAGVTRFTMGFNTAGRRLMKGKQKIALQLYVVVTPRGNVPMFRQAFFMLRRGVAPAVVPPF